MLPDSRGSRGAAVAQADGDTGPQRSQTPYVVPTAPGWEVTSILTVGDVARVWTVNPATKAAVQIFESDRTRFQPGAVGFLTQDEENSGVIEVTDIVRSANWYEAGRRYYLGNMQAHYAIPGELIEGGQLYLMASPKVDAAKKK